MIGQTFQVHAYTVTVFYHSLYMNRVPEKNFIMSKTNTKPKIK
jgi:hypothetical protein